MARENEVRVLVTKLIKYKDERVLSLLREAAVLGMMWADEHPNWRNGKEKCPPVGEEVLVRCSIKGDKELHVTGLGKYVYEDGVGCWRLGSQGGIKFNASKCVYFYWMPIPSVEGDEV